MSLHNLSPSDSCRSFWKWHHVPAKLQEEDPFYKTLMLCSMLMITAHPLLFCQHSRHQMPPAGMWCYMSLSTFCGRWPQQLLADVKDGVHWYSMSVQATSNSKVIGMLCEFFESTSSGLCMVPDLTPGSLNLAVLIFKILFLISQIQDVVSYIHSQPFMKLLS